MPTKKISVLLVDDSAVVRQVLLAILSDTPDIHVMGAASDPIFAMDKLAREWPDVIVLDVEMPRMDGITFLKKIMSERPTPVVMLSTLTAQGAEASLTAEPARRMSSIRSFSGLYSSGVAMVSSHSKSSAALTQE